MYWGNLKKIMFQVNSAYNTYQATNTALIASGVTTITIIIVAAILIPILTQTECQRCGLC